MKQIRLIFKIAIAPNLQKIHLFLSFRLTSGTAITSYTILIKYFDLHLKEQYSLTGTINVTD